MIDLHIRKQLHGVDGKFLLEVAFAVQPGELMAIYGPSGVGKTTLLRMLAGLEKPDAGRIRVEKTTWFDRSARVDLAARKRRVGLVFQDYALFPNMTVRGNIAFAQPRRQPEPALVDALLEMTGLQALADHKPRRLSGGQAQRVALARAIAARPRILLLDEALSALDQEMRQRMQQAVAKVHREFGLTTLLVSHDLAEVFLLADRVVHLREGKIVRLGTPAEVFGTEAPGSLQLIGKILALPTPAHAEVLVQGKTITLPIDASQSLKPGDTVTLNIDPKTGKMSISQFHFPPRS